MSNDIETAESEKEILTNKQEDSLRVNYLKLLEGRNTFKTNFQRSDTDIKVKRESIEKIFKLSHNKNLEDMIHHITYTVEELRVAEQPKKNLDTLSELPEEETQIVITNTEITTENIVELREEVFSEGDLVDTEVTNFTNIEIVKSSTVDEIENKIHEKSDDELGKNNAKIVSSEDPNIVSDNFANTITYEKTREVVEKSVHKTEYVLSDDPVDNLQEDPLFLKSIHKVSEEYTYEKSEIEVEKVSENTQNEIAKQITNIQNEESLEIEKKNNLSKGLPFSEKIQETDENILHSMQTELTVDKMNVVNAEPQDTINSKTTEEIVPNEKSKVIIEEFEQNVEATIFNNEKLEDKLPPGRSQPDFSVDILQVTNPNINPKDNDNKLDILKQENFENISNTVQVKNDNNLEKTQNEGEKVLAVKLEFNSSDKNTISTSLHKDPSSVTNDPVLKTKDSSKKLGAAVKQVKTLKNESEVIPESSHEKATLPMRGSVKKLSVSNSTVLENKKQVNSKLNMKSTIIKKMDVKKQSSDEESDDGSEEKIEQSQALKMPSVDSKKALAVKKAPEKKTLILNKLNTKPVIKMKQEEKASLEKIKEDNEYKKITSLKTFDLKIKNPIGNEIAERVVKDKQVYQTQNEIEEKNIPAKEIYNTQINQENFATQDVQETVLNIKQQEETDKNEKEIQLFLRESSDKINNEELEAYQKHFLNLVPKRENTLEKEEEKIIDIELFSSATKFLEDIFMNHEEQFKQINDQDTYKTPENNCIEKIPKAETKTIINEKKNPRLGERKHSTKKIVTSSKEKFKRSEEETKFKKRDQSGKKKEDTEKNPSTSTISKRDLSGHRKEFLEGKFSESKEKLDTRHKSKENKKILETNKSKNLKTKIEPQTEEKGNTKILSTGRSSQIKNKSNHQKEIDVNTDPSQPKKIGNFIEENEENPQISILEDPNKNFLLESNYITINLDIPDNRPNLDFDMLNITQNNDNLNDTRADQNDDDKNMKKPGANLSENYQDEITRYGYDESKVIETDRSVDCDKKLVNEKAYVTNYSSNAYKYNSYFLTNKLEDELDISHVHKETEEKILKNEETRDNDVFEEKIQKFENDFLVQEDLAKVEERIQNEVIEEQITYTDDVDDVVNYETMKSPITKSNKAPEKFVFDMNLTKDFDLTDKLEDKNLDPLNETNNLEKGKEIDFNTNDMDLKSQINQTEEINYETVKNNEQLLYMDYKTNLENDLLLSLDQYKSELIENIPEDYKIEKMQQIQESARRQYELLTKANSLETIHEVRSVIFNNETDDEKYIKKSSKEIIIRDEGDDKNILIDEGRITNKRNSAKASSKFSLKNIKEEKLSPLKSNNDSTNIDKKFQKTLLEVKRSAKIFNTKKWDTKPLDSKLKLIQNKIQPIKIPPKPKLIPNSNHTERAGCFSPKLVMRSSMPLIKEMGLIDICFVCKGAVVKPKQCRRCMKCVCHVCSFELEDRNKCPECNSQLVMVTKSGSTTTTMNIKKIPITEKKPTSTSYIFGKKDAHRTSALKQKYKSQIIYGCCNCKDSTIASINCPKCGKSSCVMCLNNSNDPNKCLSCQCNFKSRFSTLSLNGSQTMTRKLSQTAKKNTNTNAIVTGNISSKINPKIFYTTSTKSFSTTCAICKKSTHNRNKCTGCGKNICSLCYNNIDGEKTCGDCHGNLKVKVTTTISHKRISSDQKMTSTLPTMRPKSKNLELSNASKNLFTGDEKIEICKLCRRTKKCCNDCWKIVCSNCTKDTFEQNKCSDCRYKKSQKTNENFTQRLSRVNSDGYFVFDDICLVCKAMPDKKINCNNCRKPVCTTCVDRVKENENKCPNCNNVNYNVLAFFENKNENTGTINSEINPPIIKSLAMENQTNSKENEMPNPFAGKCLICARVPYNELKCNNCKNEVCFTCTYSMEDQYKCPLCPGILMITEKKESENSNKTLLETPKNEKSKNNSIYMVLNQGDPVEAFSPIQPVNQIDDSNFKNQPEFVENIINNSKVIQNDNTLIREAPSTPKRGSSLKEKLTPSASGSIIDNCLICKGAPIKPKSCTTCNKLMCKMCSYDIDDNKCPGCRSELNLVDAYQSERNLKQNPTTTEINKDITNTKIEEKSEGMKTQELCLVCKGFPIKPKTCDNCNTSVCTICSYELEDPSKCQECKGPYKKLGTRGSMKFKVGQQNQEFNEKKTAQDTSMSCSGPSCIVCKRPPFKPKICWSCMSAIFCTPCSFNFEDSNRCLNCQTKINKETEILKLQNNSRMGINTNGI